MPDSPQYKRVENVDIHFLGTQNLAVKSEVVYYNPNNFAVDVRKLTGELTINGHHIADVSLHDVKRADPFSEFELPLVFQVTYDKFAQSVAKSIPDLFRLQTIDLEIKGRVYLDRWTAIPIPYNYTDRYAVRIVFEGLRPQSIYLEPL